jgi:hypothetical protein
MKCWSLLVNAPSRMLVVAGALLLLAGCATERRPHSDWVGAESGAPPAPSVPEMEAHAKFFTGQIEAEVLLGRLGFAPRPAEMAAGASSGGERGRGRSSGGGPGGRRGGMGGSHGGGERGGETAGARSGDSQPGPKIRPNNAPPLQFRLRLTNHGGDPVDVEVPDFNSALGNFVVQPRKITLPPGASVEADPMTSRLGISGDEISLTVTLRTNGKTETQLLTLRPKPVAPPAAPVPGTPPAHSS